METEKLEMVRKWKQRNGRNPDPDSCDFVESGLAYWDQDNFTNLIDPRD